MKIRKILGVVLILSAALPALAGEKDWKPLFNGKDLAGWQQVGPGSFAVEDGLLKPVGGMGLLYWKEKPIGNAVIRIVYKTSRPDDNSGVFFRIPIEPREEWMPVYYGYEAQICDAGDESHVTGVLYSLNKALARPAKPAGEWNTMEIRLDGPRTVVTLNGQKVTDYTEGQPTEERKHTWEPFRGPRPDAGYIGLQNHPREDKSDSGIYFKEISVKVIR